MVTIGSEETKIRFWQTVMIAARRCALLVATSITTMGAHAATVEWNAFTLYEVFEYNERNHQSVSAEFSDLMSYPGVCMGVNMGFSCLQVSKADSMPSLMAADWAIAVFADAGDVLNWDYFKNASEAIQNEARYAPGKFKELTAPEIEDPVDIKYNTDVYLAILFWTNKDPGYTWCKLTATKQGFSMSANATAFQEGLIVGTGSFASTPEPTSGLLILLGMAGLALKRKRA